MKKFITIATFNEPLQARLAKIKLNEESIKCFLSGENFAATYWLLSGADHGVKLQVKNNDVEKAIEILENNQVSSEQIEEDLKPQPVNPLCPKCGSENTDYEKFSRNTAFLSILFLKFPIPVLRKSYKCNNCGHKWK